MKNSIRISALALLFGGALAAGCSGTSVGSEPGRLSEPDNSFARSLGISDGPIDAAQARMIAEKAANGTVLEVEREIENGVDQYAVDVQANGGIMDIEIRVSDGAVLKMIGEDEDEGDHDDGGDEENENGEPG